MRINLTPLLVNWQFLGQAVGVTLSVSALAIVVGLVIGIIAAALRTYGGRTLDIIIGFYVDVFRSIPVLAILIWTYFALPFVSGQSLNPIVAAIAALGVHLGAYVTEAIRAGLTSVRLGQFRAGLALGMSPYHVVRTIILPQALIRMLPSLGSLVVLTIKDSAIASVIAVPELLRQSQTLAGNTYRPFEIYTAAMVIYFLICYPLARLTDRIYRHYAPLGAS
jgi:His/Glu/Gln/Arg/opine family amino acid ABC transporter permease subunit